MKTYYFFKDLNNSEHNHTFEKQSQLNRHIRQLIINNKDYSIFKSFLNQSNEALVELLEDYNILVGAYNVKE